MALVLTSRPGIFFPIPKNLDSGRSSNYPERTLNHTFFSRFQNPHEKSTWVVENHWQFPQSIFYLKHTIIDRRRRGISSRAKIVCLEILICSEWSIFDWKSSKFALPTLIFFYTTHVGSFPRCVNFFKTPNVEIYTNSVEKKYALNTDTRTGKPASNYRGNT